MKKKNVKSLQLSKKTISDLKTLTNLQGGAANDGPINSPDPLTVKSCPPEVPPTWFPRCSVFPNECVML